MKVYDQAQQDTEKLLDFLAGCTDTGFRPMPGPEEAIQETMKALQMAFMRGMTQAAVIAQTACHVDAAKLIMEQLK